MSEDPFGPADALSEEQVATAVEAARPDWRLVDAEPIPAGSDILYRVTVEPDEGRDATTTERRAVLKCFRPSGPLAGRAPDRVVTEVRLLELAGAETTVPVPTVYGFCESHDAVPAPFFLMEYVEGVSETGLSPDVETTERLTREAARYLARIHDWRSFEAAGNFAVDDGDVVVDGTARWVDHLHGVVDGAVTHLDETRFSDLQAPVAEYVEERFTDAAFDAAPVLLHGDYRYGNLVVDPGRATVEAVLDWGASLAGDRLYELVWVEAEFAGNAPVGSERRRGVREALYEAYESERGVAFERDASFARRERLYRFVKRVIEMRWFPYWHGDLECSERADHAARLRRGVASML